METFFPEMLKTVAQQGVLFMVICSISWYFYNELLKVKAELTETRNAQKLTQNQLIGYLQSDRADLISLVTEMKDVIEQNTRVLENALVKSIRSPLKKSFNEKDLA